MSAGYGVRTGSGFVALSIGSVIVQMTPEEAAQIANDLHEAVEGARTDEWIANVLTPRLGHTVHEAGQLILSRREYRQSGGLTGQKEGDSENRI